MTQEELDEIRWNYENGDSFYDGRIDVGKFLKHIESFWNRPIVKLAMEQKKENEQLRKALKLIQDVCDIESTIYEITYQALESATDEN